jgi:hypothetical protein
MKSSRLIQAGVAFAAALALLAPVFSGFAEADGNPLLGEWKVALLDPSSGAPYAENQDLARQGEYYFIVFTRNSIQVGMSTHDGREMSPKDPVTYRQVSDSVWSVCATAGGDCLTATFEKGSDDRVKFREPDQSRPVMDLTRIK